MQVKAIHYNQDFEKQFRYLPLDVRRKAVKAEKLFRDNPFHHSLRLHKLKGKLLGLWSISIDRNFRLLYSEDEHSIYFFDIGTHDQVYK